MGQSPAKSPAFALRFHTFDEHEEI